MIEALLPGVRRDILAILLNQTREAFYQRRG